MGNVLGTCASENPKMKAACIVFLLAILFCPSISNAYYTVYQNGPKPISSGVELGTGLQIADDFMLSQTSRISAILYYTNSSYSLDLVQYGIWSNGQDAGNSLDIPKTLLFSGQSSSVVNISTNGDIMLMMLVLETPITLSANTHYWLSFEGSGTWLASSAPAGSLFNGDQPYAQWMGEWLNYGYSPGNLWFALQSSNDSEPSPTVTSFLIDKGAFDTLSRTVTLSIASTGGSPTYYMASESPTFKNAVWKIYSKNPTFNLGVGNGTKTVYLKLKNKFGVSLIAKAEIALGPPCIPRTYVSGTYKGGSNGYLGGKILGDTFTFLFIDSRTGALTKVSVPITETGNVSGKVKDNFGVVCSFSGHLTMEPNCEVKSVQGEWSFTYQGQRKSGSWSALPMSSEDISSGACPYYGSWHASVNEGNGKIITLKGNIGFILNPDGSLQGAGLYSSGGHNYSVLFPSDSYWDKMGYPQVYLDIYENIVVGDGEFSGSKISGDITVDGNSEGSLSVNML
jgi:hypothetical protein